MSQLLQPYQDKIMAYVNGTVMNLEIKVPTSDDLKNMITELRGFLQSFRKYGIWATNVKRKDGIFIVLKRRAASR